MATQFRALFNVVSKNGDGFKLIDSFVEQHRQSDDDPNKVMETLDKKYEKLTPEVHSGTVMQAHHGKGIYTMYSVLADPTSQCNQCGALHSDRSAWCPTCQGTSTQSRGRVGLSLRK